MVPPQSSTRFEAGHLNLGTTPTLDLALSRSESSTSQTSPIEPPSANSTRFPLGNSAVSSVQGARLGAGSPSHEFGTSAGGRLYSKRAREIQAAEGALPLSPQPQIWGPLAHPPTSGNSTPLRETIPESPNGESFPDFNHTGVQDLQASSGAVAGRRARAGTLPSRFSPSGPTTSLTPQSGLSRLPNTSRPTPTTSPFKPGSSITPGEPPGLGRSASATTAAAQRALLSRLRAGSMPQRVSLLPTSAAPSPFGSSLFSSTWGSGRDRAGTLASIRSSNEPSSPAQSSFSRDSLADTDVKTLDYLGLVDTPQQPARATLGPSDIEMLLEQQRASNVAGLVDLTKNANRFRSYSVNAKEKYADGEYEDETLNAFGSGSYSGTMTPVDSASAAAYAIQEAVRQHNLEVQAFANFASAARPRARTAGVLDTPSSRLMRSYLPQQSRLDSSISAADLPEEAEYSALASAVQGLQLNGKPAEGIIGDENTLEGPTRALWLGNIPPSTTVSSLNVIFNAFGPIESSRVLTHKNCGFVNFENTDSAIRAKNSLNGKEIFPGAGGVRIGFAKVPSASGTPGSNGVFPSPSPDPQSKGQLGQGEAGVNRSSSLRSVQNQNGMGVSAPIPHTPPTLSSLRGDILSIVKELGGSNEEIHLVSASIDSAVHFAAQLAFEIPPIPEPSHNRIHDAPRLREIRKRIDNNSYTITEIEDVAMSMLPEIAELSSDYLGNTVVQKLFEYTSDPVREAMLTEIARNGGLAEIGIHKNGTWAAQKIIDVSQSRQLQQTIVDSLRAYAVPLFLDQFGNYVVQGCLRYGAPLNKFIFETMASSLWELAQGRFGARAMRACLESHHATKEQQRMIAAAIAVHAVQLATNANGALLLTWFLDTATFPGRRRVLAPRLVEHLVELCTHKVAYLTVLKLINQRNEPEARDTILQALFFSKNDEVLEAILRDQACGATLIFKVLTTPFFDEAIRQDVVEAVRRVLLRIKAQPGQGYKRLMDEVGLSTRNGGGVRDMSLNRDEGSRPASKQATQATMNAGPIDHGFPSRGFPMQQQAFDLQRTGSMDSNFDQYAIGGAGLPGINGLNTPLYSPNAGMLSNGMQGLTPQQAQQLQYQQLLAARQQQQAQQQQGFYNPQLGPAVNNMTLQGLPNLTGMPGLNAGFPSPAPSMDQFRNVASSPVVGMGNNAMPINGGSPMLGQLPQTSFPVYGQGMVNMNNQGGQLYGYNGFAAQGMQMAGGVRRGRR